MRAALVVAALLVASSALALPPKEHGRGFVDGANHHIGDAGFLAHHHRTPTARDPEREQMYDHFTYVRDLLAARPATRPELEGKRKELLGYLSDYLAKGTTPENTYVPWRTPVFIDAKGTICAVGYLIERTAGRPLAERIAKDHRLSYIDDIAAAMPEVKSWVDESGFTLEEIATIQPGYEGPDVQFDGGFGDDQLADGAYDATPKGTHVVGAFQQKRMTGEWVATDTATNKVVGRGTFKSGAGAWRSTTPDGTLLAEGRFANNRASGTWRFYHPSGRLAAEGTFHKGLRDGAWTFYYDAPGATPIAKGDFSEGSLDGRWRHYDAAGKLLATAGRAPAFGKSDYLNDALLLHVTANAAGIVHEVHEGIPASSDRLDGYYGGSEHLYVDQEGKRYDDRGNQLEQVDGAWVAHDCHWSAARKRAALRGDVTAVHYYLMREGQDRDGTEASAHLHDCAATGTPIAAARAKRIERVLLASREVRAPTPKFVQAFVGEKSDASGDDVEGSLQAAVAGAALDGEVTVVPLGTEHAAESDDLATVLAAHMTWYMEWPHVDGMFRDVFATLPGY